MSYPFGTFTIIGSVSWQARAFTFACGITLCSWTLTKLRNRALLISICSIFIAVGLGLVSFSLAPTFFDQVSYSIGVKYPPLAYVIIAILLLMVIIVLLALKLSLIDERCRRLAQEIALIRYDTTGSGQEQTPISSDD